MIPYNLSAYKLLHEGSLALAEIETNGIRIDLKYLKKITRKTEEKIKMLVEKLKKSSVVKTWKKVYGHKMNLDSNDQLGKVLFDHMNIEPPALTPTGRYKTDEKSLMAVDHPFVKMYIKIKKLKKTLTTYLKGIEREIVDGYIHPSFNLHIVRTFRSSCDSPNFQNIPVRNEEIGKMIRKIFIARPGNHLVEIDYSAIEVRVAACYHKDPNMIEYINHPEKDMHRDMAMECYMLSASQVTKEARFYGKNCFVFPQFYGSIFSECAQNLWEVIDTFKLTTKKGTPLKKHLKKKGIDRLGEVSYNGNGEEGTFVRHIQKIEKQFWTKRFPIYARWKKNWYKKYAERGWMLTKTGFICQGFMKRNDTINYPIQGSAFHCLLWSLTRLVRKELRKHKMKTLIVGQIHDSILADVPENELDEFLNLAQRIMTTELTNTWKWINVPLEVEAEVAPIGGSWADKKERKI